MDETRRYDKNHIKELKERFVCLEERENMRDADLLALLLSFTNVKDDLGHVMDELYRSFGSFRRCFLANYTDLMRVDGMTHHGAMLILLTGKIVHLSDREDYIGRKITDFGTLFLSAIKPTMVEEFWAAALDPDDRLITIEKLGVGVQDAVSVPVANILRFATYHDSKRIVIAHSHPDLFHAEPSIRDINAMHYIGSTLGRVGIKLYGQVVVAGRNASYTPYIPEE